MNKLRTWETTKINSTTEKIRWLLYLYIYVTKLSSTKYILVNSLIYFFKANIKKLFVHFLIAFITLDVMRKYTHSFTRTWTHIWCSSSLHSITWPFNHCQTLVNAILGETNNIHWRFEGVLERLLGHFCIQFSVLYLNT